MPRLTTESGASPAGADAGRRSGTRDRLLAAACELPFAVTYELTDLGLSLHQMMRGLKTWAETHRDDVLANREEHDARTA